MNYNRHLDNLVRNVIGYQQKDAIAILHDCYFDHIAGMIYKYCRQNSVKADVTKIEYDPLKKLPSNAREIFLSHSNNIIILGFLQNIWHTDERRTAKYDLGKRLVNLLHAGNPCESYCTDFYALKRSGILKNILDDNKDKVVHITSPNGTDLFANIGQTFCEDGDYKDDGSGGDFPSGEAGFGPCEGSVNGRIVYDVKIQYIGETKEPLIVTVEEDKIVHVEGHNRRKFEELISRYPIFKYVSEISIGTNSSLCSVEDINSIVEEKNLGTFHVGNGGNKSYGNREGPHFDGVISNPTIFVGNLVLMHQGNPIAF